MNASYRTLLKQLVITDFKLRYQGSVLGYLWSLLKPMMLFGVLYVVFAYIIPLGNAIPHYPSYLLLGVIVWTFFTEATSMGLNSIVGRGDLLRKVKISKPTIVLSAVISAGVNFSLNLIVLLIFMIVSHAQITWSLIWLAPLLLIELAMLCIGLAAFLSALYVKFRDIAPIWEVLLQVLFYATPIIYPLSRVADMHLVAKLMSFNPMAQIIQDLRYIFITPDTLTTHALLGSFRLQVVPFLIVAAICGGGIWYFLRRQNSFVEDL